MQRIPVLFLTVLLTTACVDSAYDLSKIESDNITIGNNGDDNHEGSSFKIPLATVNVSAGEINSNGRTINEILDETNLWIPSALPDRDATGSYVDLGRLADSESNYSNELLAATIAEMKQSDTKLNAIIALTNERYFNQFASLVGATGPDDYAACFLATWRTSPAAIESRLTEVATAFLCGLTINGITYPIGRINLDAEVRDMIVKNMDEATGNTLHIYGTIQSRLPFNASLTASFTGTDVTLQATVNADTGESTIDEFQLTRTDFDQITTDATVHLSISLGRYYPSIGFSDDQSQLVFDFKLIKRGGMKLDL